MAKPRLNPDVARVTGADKRSPGRFAGRANPQTEPLGGPPASLSEGQQKVWLELVSDVPWLVTSDRAMVGITVRLIDALQTNPAGFPLSGYAQLRLCLSSLGATPVDRSKVSIASNDRDDSIAEFVN